MKLTIVYFSTVLIAFHPVIASHSLPPDISQIMRDVEEIMKTGSENDYKNSTILAEVDKYNKLIILQKTKSDVKLHFQRLADLIIGHLSEILTLRTNTTKYIAKMMYDIDTLRYSIKKSLAKENNPETTEELLRSVENEELKNEQKKLLKQMRILEHELLFPFHRKCMASSDPRVLSEALISVAKAFNKCPHENCAEVPLQMNWNKDVNDEEPLLKLDIDRECDELEKLRRSSLMVQDELNEMPRANNGSLEDNIQSGSNTPDSISESITVPRWLHQAKDIEEIQLAYVRCANILQLTHEEPVKVLKQAIKKGGFSMNLFCKLTAESQNFATKLVECESQEDAECIEMITEMRGLSYYKKAAQIFMTATDPYYSSNMDQSQS
ncbi:uncharacterized protein LOC135835201 [Planococcus citri]|uniref:uncharacterized protein LOC135835201 n=1 Tax=Planococcus citri TaxID=170843 RepID=UPI0031F9EE84